MPRTTSPDAPEKPTRVTLAEPAGGSQQLVFFLDRNRLVSPTIVQDFKDAKEAAAHLERVLQIRKKAGWVLKATETVTNAVVEKAIDALDAQPETGALKKKRTRKAGLEIEMGDERCTVTFAEPKPELSELFSRLKRERPSSLHLRCDPVTPGEVWAKEVAGQRFSSIEGLIFDTEFQSPIRQARFSLGDLSKTFAAFPSLKRAFFSGASPMSTCRHELLRELTLLGDPLDDETQLAGLGRSHFPVLERLVLGLCVEADPIDGPAVVAAIAKIDAPALSRVVITGLADVTPVLDGLITAFSDLKLLSLSGSMEEEALVRCVKAHTQRLRHIDTLALSCDDELSSDGVAELRALLPNLRDTTGLPSSTQPEAYRTW